MLHVLLELIIRILRASTIFIIIIIIKLVENILIYISLSIVVAFWLS